MKQRNISTGQLFLFFTKGTETLSLHLPREHEKRDPCDQWQLMSMGAVV